MTQPEVRVVLGPQGCQVSWVRTVSTTPSTAAHGICMCRVLHLWDVPGCLRHQFQNNSNAARLLHRPRVFLTFVYIAVCQRQRRCCVKYHAPTDLGSSIHLPRLCSLALDGTSFSLAYLFHVNFPALIDLYGSVASRRVCCPNTGYER